MYISAVAKLNKLVYFKKFEVSYFIYLLFLPFLKNFILFLNFTILH